LRVNFKIEEHIGDLHDVHFAIENPKICQEIHLWNSSTFGGLYTYTREDSRPEGSAPTECLPSRGTNPVNRIPLKPWRVTSRPPSSTFTLRLFVSLFSLSLHRRDL